MLAIFGVIERVLLGIIIGFSIVLLISFLRLKDNEAIISNSFMYLFESCVYDKICSIQSVRCRFMVVTNNTFYIFIVVGQFFSGSKWISL